MSNLTIPERIAELILQVGDLEPAPLEWSPSSNNRSLLEHNIIIEQLRDDAQRLALDMNL
jgi:hypothetical protein